MNNQEYYDFKLDLLENLAQRGNDIALVFLGIKLYICGKKEQAIMCLTKASNKKGLESKLKAADKYKNDEEKTEVLLRILANENFYQAYVIADLYYALKHAGSEEEALKNDTIRFNWAQEGAKKDILHSKRALAFCYNYGIGVKQSKKKANDIYKSISNEQKCINIRDFLATDEYYDYDINKLKELSKKGDVNAQITLARKYAKEGNSEESHKWYELAAKNNNLFAKELIAFDAVVDYGQKATSLRLDRSDRIKVYDAIRTFEELAKKNIKESYGDLDKAYHFLTFGFENNCEYTKFFNRLAFCATLMGAYVNINLDSLAGYYTYKSEDIDINKNIKLAIQLYENDIKQNDKSAALSTLANIYYDGEGGVRKNYKKAIEYASKGYELGIIRESCALILGNCYFYGYGVEKNYKEAMRYYEECAKDCSESYGNRCICYLEGLGVTKNLNKAKEMLISLCDNYLHIPFMSFESLRKLFDFGEKIGLKKLYFIAAMLRSKASTDKDVEYFKLKANEYEKYWKF